MSGTQEKEAVLGIDFGTTYTFVIKGYINNTEEQLFPIGGDLYEDTQEGGAGDILKYSNGIRTVIGYSEKYGWSIGRVAIERFKKGEIDRDDMYYNLKKDLLNICKVLQKNSGWSVDKVAGWIEEQNNSTKEEYGHRFGSASESKYYNAIELAKRFFELLFNNNGECYAENSINGKRKDLFSMNKFDDIKCIVIGTPAAGKGADEKTTYYSEVVLKDILDHINKILKLDLAAKDMRVIPEPQLAGKAFIAEGRLALGKGEQLLVIDIGGGTTDFAVLMRKGDIYIAPVSPKGDIPIAGDVFDNVLENCITENYTNAKKARFAHEAIRQAKEELFLTKNSSKIENLGKQALKENPSPVVNLKDEIKVIYEEYRTQGRRTAVQATEGGRPYGVCWNIEHRKGLTGDGYVDVDFSHAPVYNVPFTKRAEELAESLKEYILDLKKAGELNWAKLKVLFVGGSSRMKELCYTLCEIGLGLKSDTEKIKWSKQVGNKDVPINVSGLVLQEKESNLTCANMIAIGAVCFAQDQLSTNTNNAIYSVPTLLLGIPIFDESSGKEVGMNYYPLISQNMKNGVFKNLKAHVANKEIVIDVSQWPYVFRYNMDKEKCIKFIILKQVQSTTNIQWDKIEGNYVKFPRGNHQYYAFNASRIEKSICDELKNYYVLFLADRPQGGRLAIFVCILKKNCDKNDEQYEIIKYNYGTPNDLDEGIANVEKFKNSEVGAQLIGTQRYGKRYLPYGKTEESKSGDQPKGLSGRRYSIQNSIQKWANSEGYGWILKKQEVSNHAGDGK